MLINPSFQKTGLVIRNYGTVEIRQNIETGHKSLHSTVSFNKNEVICPFDASAILPAPSKFTIQLNEGRHITLHPSFLQFVNHSCDPNIFFDTGSMSVICIEPILAGDELAFFYPSTEWSMAEPFDCHCGSPDCIKQVRGAAYLPYSLIRFYKLTLFIQQKLLQRKH